MARKARERGFVKYKEFPGPGIQDAEVPRSKGKGRRTERVQNSETERA